MRLVGAGDRFQSRGDGAELPVAQLPSEVSADASKMRPRGSPKDLPPRVGQPCQHDPRVAVGAIPLDETLGDKPVHRPGESARRDHHPLGELGHAKGVAGSTGQAEQHVVRAHGEAVFLTKLGVELPEDVVVGVEKRLPGPELRLGEPRVHDRGV